MLGRQPRLNVSLRYQKVQHGVRVGGSTARTGISSVFQDGHCRRRTERMVGAGGAGTRGDCCVTRAKRHQVREHGNVVCGQAEYGQRHAGRAAR